MTATAPHPLEQLLADPHDPGNPLSYAAVVAADERAEMLAEGEARLDRYGLNAEFVPPALGGRLTEADTMVRTVRAVFRRDPTLGLGYGITNLIAAVIVWASGNTGQQSMLAERLLRGRKISAAYNELAHGNDFTRTDFAAVAHDGTYVLSGGKQLINNIARADAAVLLARTSKERGPRSHTHLLVDLTTADPSRIRFRRYPTVGVRGCHLGGMDVDRLPVPQDSVIGEPGAAMDAVMRAFQLTRAVIPGLAVGSLDTQLRTVLRFTRERSLYGAPAIDLPYVHTTLAAAFADLLVSDCLATTALRALHVLPGQASIYAAAAKYLSSNLLKAAATDLAAVLGARSYLREGPYAIVQKHLRDLPAVNFAHANNAVCQAVLIPQLPALARRSWLSAPPPPAELFALHRPLPALDFQALALTARGEDPVCGVLSPDAGPTAGGDPTVAALRGLFVDELRRLQQACGSLGPRDRSLFASPTSYDLARRYSVVVAAGACIGIWGANQGEASPFMRSETWLTCALLRLAGQLGHDVEAAFARLAHELVAELIARQDDNRSLDLSAVRLAG